MPKFKVPVEWTLVGYYYIEAETEQIAILMVDPSRGLPQSGDYLDGSFNVWEDGVEEVEPIERSCFCSIFGEKEICGDGCINDEC